MLSRRLKSLIQKRLKQYPAVALLGPRQCGKTTLAKSLKAQYFDLEQEKERFRLDLELEDLSSKKELLILDEAQTYPEIFPRLRGLIDSKRKQTGRFLLLGSVAYSLAKNISEVLTGRVAFLELNPFSFMEVNSSKLTLQNLWLKGGYPEGGLLNSSQFFHWQKNYLKALAERDLIDWGMPSKASFTLRLMKMLSHVHGNLWNASQISNSLSLNYKTVTSYLDYLEGAFLIRRLPPFHTNISKRLIKSPKIYWRDSGILHHFFHVKTIKELKCHPQCGFSWEGFVIEQILSTLSFQDISFETYFFRTSDNYEIDLIIDFGSQKWAIEIKLTSSPSIENLKQLRKINQWIKVDKLFLISNSKKILKNKNLISCNLEWMLKFLLRKDLCVFQSS